MSDNSKSILLALFAVISWSTIATALKISLAKFNYTDLLFYASIFSFIFYSIVIISTKKTYKILEISRQELVLSIIRGFLNPFFYYLILFKAYSLLKAQEALSLNYTWAIILTIFIAIFQKKKIKILSFFALLISFIGVLVILSRGKIFILQPSDPLGAFLAISSAFVWGAYWLLNSISKLDSTIRMFYNFFFGTFFVFFFQILFGEIKILPLTYYLPITYISLFEMGITFIIWDKALQLTKKPVIVNNLIYLSPIFSLSLINLFLGEKIESPTFLGFILILGGILLQYYFNFYSSHVSKL